VAKRLRCAWWSLWSSRYWKLANVRCSCEKKLLWFIFGPPCIRSV